MRLQAEAIRAAGPADRESVLIERAEALIPALRERSAATGTERRPSEETRCEIKRSGIVQLLQPARYGGAEARLRTGVDILAAIGRGCGSTAWIVVQNILHNLMIASWPEDAQDVVWKETPDVLVSGILIPGIGKCRAVRDGYVVSGRWPFVSGVNIADWLIVSAAGTGDGSGADDRHFLVPRHEVRILDTWYAIGLKGSASNDVILEDVFVPGHMSVTMEQLKGHGTGPGLRINAAPVHQIPPYALFGAYIGSAALGIAQAAVDEYIGQVRGRIATMSGARMGSYTTQQVKVAEAQSAVIAARRLLISICDEAQEAVEAGRVTTVEDRTRYRALATYAGKLSASAVNLVIEAAAGSAIYERNPLSRFATDMLVANRHTTQNWDVNASAYGRALLGLAVENPALDD
jgi:3-hydroxy-9,10-secoandrosta-1,3,5(10)-triene-9,17-dione monooxygenase